MAEWLERSDPNQKVLSSSFSSKPLQMFTQVDSTLGTLCCDMTVPHKLNLAGHSLNGMVL